MLYLSQSGAVLFGQDAVREMGARGDGEMGRHNYQFPIHYQLSITNYQLPITNAQLPMPNSLCLIPNFVVPSTLARFDTMYLKYEGRLRRFHLKRVINNGIIWTW